MLKKVITNPFRPLPRVLRRTPGWRHTAVVVLVNTQQNKLALVLPKKAHPNGFIPPQGGMQLPHESLAAAARRELGEEVPSVRRPHPHARPRIDWHTCLSLGSVVNPHVRNGVPKHLHVAAFRASAGLELRPDGVECVDAAWVSCPDQLERYLRGASPLKVGLVFSALALLQEAGLMN